MLGYLDSDQDWEGQSLPGCHYRIPHWYWLPYLPYRCRMPRQSIMQDREAVARAVSQGRSIAEALELLGLRPAGGNYRALHQACARFGLAVPAYRPASKSRLPVSNGSPAPYKGAALPDELRRPASDVPADGNRKWLPAAVLVIAGLAAGCALALAIRDGSRASLAEAAAVCLLVLLAVAT